MRKTRYTSFIQENQSEESQPSARTENNEKMEIRHEIEEQAAPVDKGPEKVIENTPNMYSNDQLKSITALSNVFGNTRLALPDTKKDNDDANVFPDMSGFADKFSNFKIGPLSVSKLRFFNYLLNACVRLGSLGLTQTCTTT